MTCQKNTQQNDIQHQGTQQNDTHSRMPLSTKDTQLNDEKKNDTHGITLTTQTYTLQ
jgi:hypothetical protein